jgi:hypothetical protein
MRFLVKNILPLFFALVATITLRAQAISLPFLCGFEDSLEIANWTLNAGSDGVNCLDKWMIGNTDYNEGYNSLYISCDSGMTTNYGARPNLSIAYRTIEIPSSLGGSRYSVDISFDYKCVGRDKVSMLKFWFLPIAVIGGESSLQASSSRLADIPYCLASITPNATLLGEQNWNSWSITDNQRPQTLLADTKYCMVFIWQNSNTDTAQLYPQAAVIDNIQITLSDCWKPEEIKTESSCDTLWVEWSGSNEMYEFEYRPSDKKNWRGKTFTSNKNVVIPNLSEGSYDVRVRGLCRNSDGDGWIESAWITKNGVICFCPERHCIDYVTLDRPGVSCLVGKATDPTKGRAILNRTNLGTSGAGPLDFGSNNMRSRHTVNWKQGEYDPRTGNRLKTIPDGSFASVRLGNWDVDAQAEGITYEHYVDTTEAYIILMKYAVVLEAPGHGPEEDPYFKLELIDEWGKVISRKCGEFEFTPDGNVKWSKHGNYVWKDWTAIGLNLSEYHGQTIQIRLITQDCTRTAHGGYAYFTLDCVDAVIKSTGCGDELEMEMEAPDGFKYFWTKTEDRENAVSTERSIRVPTNDTTTYYCRVDYVDVDGCGFELSTSVLPRYPHAEFEWEWVAKNCENKIFLRNKSCVYTRIDSVSVPTTEPCEAFEWVIDNGKTEYKTETNDVSYTVSNDGDTLVVSLTAYISDRACDSSFSTTIIVPPIYAHNDTLHEIYCEGSVRSFNKKTIAVDGVYTEKLQNCWECDSVTVLDVKFLPLPDDVYISDTICSNDVYVFDGQELKTTGNYRAVFDTEYGCDSVVFLNLYVEDPITVDFGENYRAFCSGETEIEIKYNLEEGSREPKFYSVLFDALAHRCGFVDQKGVPVDLSNETFTIRIPENCRPNSYSASIFFEDESVICDADTLTLNFDVYYSASIMQPKFDNLISIYNEEFNGGYTFVSYQWYKNDEIMEGETSPYLYLREGETFSPGDCYYLELERADDGVVMPTCPICPGDEGTAVDDLLDGTDLLKMTLLDKSQRVYIEGLFEGRIFVYSITGQLLDEFYVDEDTPYFVSPNAAGVYLLHFVDANRAISYSYKIQVR